MNSFKSGDTYVYSGQRITLEDINEGQHITHVIISSSIKFLPDYLFDGWKLLSAVTFEQPSHLTKIGRGVFQNCSSLIRIEGLPTTHAVSISYLAFAACASLRVFKMPSSIAGVHHFTFSGCSSLKHVELPPNGPIIGRSALRHCFSLQHIDLPPTINCIHQYAFSKSSLMVIHIPPSVRTIKEYAFHECSNLRVVHISSTDMIQINEYAFSKCPNVLILADDGDIDHFNLYNLGQPVLHHDDFEMYVHLLSGLPDYLEEREQLQMMHDTFEQNFDATTVEIVNFQGMNPLHIASYFPNISLDSMEMILRKFPVAAKMVDAHGQTPLHTFTHCKNKNMNAFQLLCNNSGLDAIHRAILSRSPLLHAVKSIASGNAQALYIAEECSGLYPFHLAGMGDNGDVSTVYELLQLHPDIMSWW